MRHSLITKVWILTGVVGVADFSFGATFVTFMQTKGLSAAVIGALLAITGVTSVVFEAPSGAWGDRFGHKRLVMIGLTAWGVGLTVFALATGAGLFAIAIGMWGAGLALYSGAATSMLINTLNAGDEGHAGAAAIRGTETVRWAAAALGACVVIVSGLAVDMRATYFLSGALLLGAALWVLIRWPESPTRSTTNLRTSLRMGLRFVASTHARPLVIFSVVAAAALAVIILTWQPVVLTIVGLESRWLGVVLLTLSASAAAGAAASVWLVRLSPFAAVSVALGGVAVSLLLLGAGAVGATVAYLGAEFFIGGALTMLAIWAQAIIPDEIRATATSILGTAAGLAIAGTYALFGLLWDTLGLAPAVSLTAAILLVASAVTALVMLFAGQSWKTKALTPAAAEILRPDMNLTEEKK